VEIEFTLDFWELGEERDSIKTPTYVMQYQRLHIFLETQKEEKEL